MRFVLKYALPTLPGVHTMALPAEGELMSVLMPPDNRPSLYMLVPYPQGEPLAMEPRKVVMLYTGWPLEPEQYNLPEGRVLMFMGSVCTSGNEVFHVYVESKARVIITEEIDEDDDPNDPN